MKRSNRLIVALTFIGAVWTALPRAAFGHADIEVRIADLTKKIDADPMNAELFMKRGELHRVHRDWEAAMADYRRAAEIDPQLSAVRFVRGRMLFEAGRPQEALIDLNRFLAIAGNEVGIRREALITRARVRVELGKFVEAAEDYTEAIATLTRHTPEYYLERSRALAKAGLLPQALQGVDEGIERAGPLVTLEFYAIELELELEKYDDALARLDTIARWMPQERFLFRRGEILRRAGRIDEARHAYLAALQAVERSTRPRQDLRQQLRSALEQLSQS